jgi:hypothetical protein
MGEARYLCPVCGYDELREPPYEQYGDPVPVGIHGEPLELGSPTHTICPSCSFHFGYDDDFQTLGIPAGLLLDELYAVFDRWREQWIANGMEFWSRSWRQPPAGWDPVSQLRRVGHNVASHNT